MPDLLQCLHLLFTLYLFLQKKKKKLEVVALGVCASHQTRRDGIRIYLCLVPAGRRAPGNQSGRGKDGGAQSRLGKAVRGEIKRKWRSGRGIQAAHARDLR